MQNSIVGKRPPMVRKQLLMTPEQNSRLKALAATTQRPESELVREALDSWLASQQVVQPDWKAHWRQAAGLWEDREDLDDMMPRLRASWDRPAGSLPPATRKRR